jgi:hypothetical protein
MVAVAAALVYALVNLADFVKAIQDGEMWPGSWLHREEEV